MASEQQVDGAIYDYCPSWCIEESERVGGFAMRVPADAHNPDWHTSSSTSVVAASGATGQLFARLVERNRHGEMPTPRRQDDPNLLVEISDGADDAPLLMTFRPAQGRALAAHLVHLADLADGLPLFATRRG